MTRILKVKLYPSDPQLAYLQRIREICTEVQAHFLRFHVVYYRHFHKYPSAYRLGVHLTKLRKLDKYAHWNEVIRRSLTLVLHRIDRSYKTYFGSLKNGVKARPPRKAKFCMSFDLSDSYKIEQGYLHLGLPYSGKGARTSHRIKFRGLGNHRLSDMDLVKFITIKKFPTGYYLFITYNADSPQLCQSGEAVGIDFGLKHFLTLSNGNKIESPLFMETSMKKLRKLSKSFSRKKIGSKNRGKARWMLRVFWEKLENKQKDFFYKLSLDLVRAYDLIVVETLELKAMFKLWGRKMKALSFGKFLNILEYTCLKYGKEFRKIGKWTPTTSVCADCGHKLEKKLELSERTWNCPVCGCVHDRDVNAARNILKEGLRTSFASERLRTPKNGEIACGDGVRLTKPLGFYAAVVETGTRLQPCVT
jgi:putative transposase